MLDARVEVKILDLRAETKMLHLGAETIFVICGLFKPKNDIFGHFGQNIHYFGSLCIYIMQGSFKTTFFVQNLSFFVSFGNSKIEMHFSRPLSGRLKK